MENSQETEDGLSSMPARWRAEHAAFLAPAMAGDETCGIAWLQQSVEQGRAVLLEVRSHDRLAGCYVLRFEECENGREAVIVAAGGALAGVSLIDTFLPVIERQARAMGCAWIRGHTSHDHVMRGYEQAGFDQLEIVYRKKLHG